MISHGQENMPNLLRHVFLFYFRDFWFSIQVLEASGYRGGSGIFLQLQPLRISCNDSLVGIQSLGRFIKSLSLINTFCSQIVVSLEDENAALLLHRNDAW